MSAPGNGDEEPELSYRKVVAILKGSSVPDVIENLHLFMVLPGSDLSDKIRSTIQGLKITPPFLKNLERILSDISDPNRATQVSKSNPQLKTLTTASVDVVCAFCKRYEINEVEWGEMFQLDDIVVHYFCLLFCAALNQKGEDHEGILGFLPADIKKELRRGEKLKCKWCKKNGATVGCTIKTCKYSFHFTCGVEKGTLHHFRGNYKSYCPIDKPVVVIPIAVDQWECQICQSNVEVDENPVWPPCCKVRVFHRRCMQLHAMTSGYFFSCPWCRDKLTFVDAMKDAGVFVPEQDAKWELEPGAYEDLHRNYTQCDAKPCICYKPGKREYDRPESRKWAIIRCNYCGSSGVHIKCGGLSSAKEKWICAGCKAIAQRDAGESSDDAEGLTPEDALVRAATRPLLVGSERDAKRCAHPSQYVKNLPLQVVQQDITIAVRLRDLLRKSFAPGNAPTAPADRKNDFVPGGSTDMKIKEDFSDRQSIKSRIRKPMEEGMSKDGTGTPVITVDPRMKSVTSVANVDLSERKSRNYTNQESLPQFMNPTLQPGYGNIKKFKIPKTKASVPSHTVNNTELVLTVKTLPMNFDKTINLNAVPSNGTSKNSSLIKPVQAQGTRVISPAREEELNSNASILTNFAEDPNVNNFETSLGDTSLLENENQPTTSAMKSDSENSKCGFSAIGTPGSVKRSLGASSAKSFASRHQTPVKDSYLGLDTDECSTYSLKSSQMDNILEKQRVPLSSSSNESISSQAKSVVNESTPTAKFKLSSTSTNSITEIRVEHESVENTDSSTSSSAVGPQTTVISESLKARLKEHVSQKGFKSLLRPAQMPKRYYPLFYSTHNPECNGVSTERFSRGEVKPTFFNEFGSSSSTTNIAESDEAHSFASRESQAVTVDDDISIVGEIVVKPRRPSVEIVSAKNEDFIDYVNGAGTSGRKHSDGNSTKKNLNPITERQSHAGNKEDDDEVVIIKDDDDDVQALDSDEEIMIVSESPKRAPSKESTKNLSSAWTTGKSWEGSSTSCKRRRMGLGA